MRVDSAGGDKGSLGLQFCGTAPDWEVRANSYDCAILDARQKTLLQLGAPCPIYLDADITVRPDVRGSHHGTIADD